MPAVPAVPAAPSRIPRARHRQLSLDDLGTPLAEAEMVVVDLETTGTDPSSDAITEIGAVKVRGGEVLGEFRTFVDPHRPIPAYIASLTGITDATVAGAPDIETVMPMFAEFARGCALVAHNARFDMGFLRAAAAAIELDWEPGVVLDTLRLARLAYGRDEVRDHRLGTLAAHVGAAVAPDHRALSDARATVDVLHAAIERLSNRGMTTLEDLAGAHRRASAVQQRQRHLADSVPSAPGVYQFVDDHGAVLYVGTSRDLRTRVRTYFTAAETRRRVLDMLPRARSITTIVCATPTEAAVRELRIIAEKQPGANRHGLRPEKATWLRLGPGREGLRGARIARDESDGSAQIGPLRSRHDVDLLRGLLTDAILGRGAAFERTTGMGPSGEHHARLRAAMLEDPAPVLDHGADRMSRLVELGRYEDAAAVRSGLETYLAAARRAQRLRAIARCPLLVAARPAPPPIAAMRPGWELLAVRGGRFAGATTIGADGDPVGAARALASTSTGESELVAPLCHGYHQEAEILLGWLEGEGVRIVLSEGSWSQGVRARFDAGALQERWSARLGWDAGDGAAAPPTGTDPGAEP
ncbi:DEDD exonuclease domain-containing protein [Brachybacterium huguangmaarense]